MDDYTIYCTKKQIKQAFALGAPLEFFDMFKYEENSLPKFVRKNIFDIEEFCYCPTAEQMIGWLEEQLKGAIAIDKCFYYGHREWIWNISDDYENIIDTNIVVHPSRKKATLAAIDAALEYLTNNKE